MWGPCGRVQCEMDTKWASVGPWPGRGAAVGPPVALEKLAPVKFKYAGAGGSPTRRVRGVTTTTLRLLP